jgi:hypothetical protein
VKNNSVPKTFLGIPAKRIFWLFVYSLVLCLVVGFVVWFFVSKNYNKFFYKSAPIQDSSTSKDRVRGPTTAKEFDHPGFSKLQIGDFLLTAVETSSVNSNDPTGSDYGCSFVYPAYYSDASILTETGSRDLSIESFNLSKLKSFRSESPPVYDPMPVVLQRLDALSSLSSIVGEPFSEAFTGRKFWGILDLPFGCSGGYRLPPVLVEEIPSNFFESVYYVDIFEGNGVPIYPNRVLIISQDNSWLFVREFPDLDSQESQSMYEFIEGAGCYQKESPEYFICVAQIWEDTYKEPRVSNIDWSSQILQNLKYSPK